MEEAILLGFRADVQMRRIRLPGANIEGDWLTVAKPVFNTGNTLGPLKSLQELRGGGVHTLLKLQPGVEDIGSTHQCVARTPR